MNIATASGWVLAGLAIICLIAVLAFAARFVNEDGGLTVRVLEQAAPPPEPTPTPTPAPSGFRVGTTSGPNVLDRARPPELVLRGPGKTIRSLRRRKAATSIAST